MKLLGSPRSPFARKAHVAMLEKQVACEYVFDSPSAAGSQVPVHNPLGKIPVLVRDDGRALYDSVVIVEYFDQVGRGPRLIPEAFEDRIEVLRLEALGDGITDAIVILTHDDRYKAGQRDPAQPWYAKQLKKIERGLAALEAEVGEGSFCFGGAFSVADICAGMALAYMDQMYPSFGWRERFPGLKRYGEAILARPSFRQTQPPAA